MKRHLIIKIGAIGDIIMTAPAVKELKESEDCEIHWACGHSCGELVAQFNFIDRIIELPDKALYNGNKIQRVHAIIGSWLKLSAFHYNSCFLLHQSAAYRLLSWPVRADRRIALKNGDRKTTLLPGRHHPSEYRRIVLRDESLGTSRAAAVQLKQRTNRLPPKRKRVVLAPGGARNLLRNNPQRRWPVEHYASVGRTLAEQGHEVILIGTADDAWILPYFEGIPINSQVGRLSIKELIAFFDSCDILVTHDSGPLHLASLSYIPVVALFGPTSPAVFAPIRENITTIWGGEHLACRPCYDGREFADCRANVCMSRISLTTVLDRVEEMLSKTTCADRIAAATATP